MIKNRVFALIYRVILFVVILCGVLLNTGIFDGELKMGAFMYYTILSNVLALVLLAILIVNTARSMRGGKTRGSASFVPRFEFVCVIDLFLTFAVYWLLLAPTIFSMAVDNPMWSFGNLSVHLIAPLGCLLDYILFTKFKGIKYRDIYTTLLFPLGYALFATIMGFLGYSYGSSASDGNPLRFPYPFIDYDRNGIDASIVNILCIGVAIVIVAHIFYFFAKKSRKKKVRR